MSGQPKPRFTVVAASYVIFRDNNKVLLSRRANSEWFNGSYSLPAGHLKGGESLVQAAIREAREEVGAKLSLEELNLVHVTHYVSEVPARHERVIFFFQTNKLHPEITNLEPHKCDELRWCEIPELPDNMVPEVKLALKKIKQGTAYSDLGFN